MIFHNTPNLYNSLKEFKIEKYKTFDHIKDNFHFELALNVSDWLSSNSASFLGFVPCSVLLRVECTIVGSPG